MVTDESVTRIEFCVLYKGWFKLGVYSVLTK